MSPPRPIRNALTAALAIAIAVATAAAAATAPLPARAQGLTPYVLVDQWPRGNEAPEALVADPQGLDVDAEDRVFISDRTAGGVVTLLPNGDFLPPFGATGTGPERLASPGRLAVDQERGRVYVVDRGTDRIVAYGLDGSFQTAWSAAAVAIAVGPDGTVFTAGSGADEVTAFSPDGARRWTYGATGSADGQFVHPADIGVDDAGKIVAVSDLDGYRVQLFDVGAGGLRFRRSIDLSQSKYNRYRASVLPLYFRCHADVVQPLGDDAVWVGDGTGACIFEADAWRYTIASVAGDRSLCKLTVRLPRLRPSTGQYAALATHDPNVGPCFSAKRGIDVVAKDTRLPTSPAVVRYADPDLRSVTSFVLATGDRDPHRIVGPQRIDIPVPGRVFVQDAGLNLHTLGQDGAPLAATPKRDAWQISQPFRAFVDLAAGSPVDGEVFAYYRRETREWDGARWTWEEREHGLDRFRGVPQRVHDRTIDVIASVWPERRAWSTRSPEALALIRQRSSWAAGYLGTIDLAYNRTVDEVVALVREQTETGVDDVARLVALRGDGTGPLRRTQLPGFSVGAAEVSGYVDLDVGADGRVYALDDLADRVVSFGASGAPGNAVAVAPDARAVAGGPDGDLFTLGAGGYVERRRLVDGVLTARFDARPLMGADPSTLTGLEVDDAGRVYVADALSSIVSVYAPGDAAAAVPEGATCVARAAKVAAPARVAVGDAVDVALTLGGACGAGEAPADIVIVTPQIVRIRSDDRLRWEVEIAARLHRLLGHIARLDLTRHRVGLVTYAQGAATTLPLTHDRDTLIAAIRRMNTDRTFSDPTGIKAGLAEAGQLFDPGDGRPDVVLIVEANYCSLDLAAPGLEGWFCNKFPRAEEAAAALRTQGARIVVAETAQAAKPVHSASEYEWHARTLATSSDDVVGFGQSAHARLVETIVPPALGTNLVLTDTLPANMALVAGSPQPAGATVAGDDIVWSQAELPFGPTTFRLQVRPQQVGRWPTNVHAVARFTDAWGKPQAVVFPIPEIAVVAGPSPTPPPTATVRATDEPTPAPPGTPGGAGTPGVPGDGRIFLPIARCDRLAGQ